jgi:uncharacterized membrane protein
MQENEDMQLLVGTVADTALKVMLVLVVVSVLTNMTLPVVAIPLIPQLHAARKQHASTIFQVRTGVNGQCCILAILVACCLQIVHALMQLFLMEHALCVSTVEHQSFF